MPEQRVAEAKNWDLRPVSFPKVCLDMVKEIKGSNPTGGRKYQ